MSRPTMRFSPWGFVLAALIASPLALAVRAEPPERIAALRPLLKDPASAVRLRSALTLAQADDADAFPVLIDLLAELSVEQRQPVEEVLTQLAGEWSPAVQFQSEDAISRHIRRDVWASWWRHTDGATLLAAVRKHTLTPEGRAKVVGLIAQLGDAQFGLRENASKELFALGRITLPQLRGATQKRRPGNRPSRQAADREHRASSGQSSADCRPPNAGGAQTGWRCRGAAGLPSLRGG